MRKQMQTRPVIAWGRLLLLGMLLGLLPPAALAAPAPASAGTLNVTGALWPPYLDPDLPDGGLAVDLVRTALERAGYTIKASAENWPRAYQGTVVGVYDVVAAIWESSAREEDLLFSDAYLLNDLIFLARPGVRFNYTSPQDLAGLRVGVLRDFAYDEAFDASPEVNRVVSNHLIQNLLLLRQGKIDVLVADKLSVFYQISKFMPDDADRFVLIPTPLARRALRLGVSRTNAKAEQIVRAFDAEIAAMRKDGTFLEIVRKHTDGIAALPGKR